MFNYSHQEQMGDKKGIQCPTPLPSRSNQTMSECLEVQRHTPDDTYVHHTLFVKVGWILTGAVFCTHLFSLPPSSVSEKW